MSRIRHTKPLGDASEVYNASVTAKHSARFEEQYTWFRISDTEAELFVEEIHEGVIALSTTMDVDGVEVGELTQLSAETARKLGNVLIRAAEYAEAQEVNDDEK